jgi:hypothetical protein
MWRRENRAEGEARTRFFVAQNARIGHFAVTVCYAMCGRLVILFVHKLINGTTIAIIPVTNITNINKLYFNS